MKLILPLLFLIALSNECLSQGVVKSFNRKEVAELGAMDQLRLMQLETQIALYEWKGEGTDGTDNELEAKCNSLRQERDEILKNADSNPAELDILPSFQSSLKGLNVAPGIQLSAFKEGKFEKSFLSGAFSTKLFSVTEAEVDSLSRVSLDNFFVPEASVYGIQVSGMLAGAWPGAATQQTRFFSGLECQLNILGKQLVDPNSIEQDLATVNIAHLRTEITPIGFKEYISFYVGFNALTGLTNVNLLGSYFSEKGFIDNVKGCIDLGLKSYVSLTQKDSDGRHINLFVDMNYTLNGGDVLALTQSSDPGFLVLRIGVDAKLAGLNF